MIDLSWLIQYGAVAVNSPCREGLAFVLRGLWVSKFDDRADGGMMGWRPGFLWESLELCV